MSETFEANQPMNSGGKQQVQLPLVLLKLTVKVRALRNLLQSLKMVRKKLAEKDTRHKQYLNSLVA